MPQGWVKSEIINRFAQFQNYRRFLEISTPISGGHFAEIDRARFGICHRLVYRCPPGHDDGQAIDFRSPNDDISDCVSQIRKSKLRYDVILVDGYHVYDTSIRDLRAAFDLLAPSGLILQHDCLPPAPHEASPTFVEGPWLGVVYKAFIDFVMERDDLYYCTLDCDYGCGLIRKKSRLEMLRDQLVRPRLGRTPTAPPDVHADLVQGWRRLGNDFAATFDFMQKHKAQLMKVMSPQDFSGAPLGWPNWMGLEAGVRDEVLDVAAMANAVPQDLTVAAVIPLYNGAGYIETAIGSVLAQSRPPDEIVVVDDGSIDAGPEIVERLARKHPIRFLRKSNGGQASARNFGVANTRSTLIAFLDQDDCWYSHHLEMLIEPFRDRHAVPTGWTYSDVDEIDEAGTMVRRNLLQSMTITHPKRNLRSCLGEDMFILPSASLISRAAFNQAGGFDERLSGYEDDDLFLRLFRLGFGNVFIEQPTAQWRVHSRSASYSPRMARSRMIYANKLYSQFPDDYVHRRFLSRNVIAPRFARSLLGQYDLEIRRSDGGHAAQVISDLWETAHHLRLRMRWPLYLALTLMRFRPFGRLLSFAFDVRRYYRGR